MSREGMRNDAAGNTEQPINTPSPRRPFAFASSAGRAAEAAAEAAAEDPLTAPLWPQRMVGALLVAVGIFLGYSMAAGLLQDAAKHVNPGAEAMFAMGVDVMIVAWGSTLLFFPRFALEHFGGYRAHEPRTRTGAIFGLANGALGLAVWLLLALYFKAISTDMPTTGMP